MAKEKKLLRERWAGRRESSNIKDERWRFPTALPVHGNLNLTDKGRIKDKEISDGDMIGAIYRNPAYSAAKDTMRKMPRANPEKFSKGNQKQPEGFSKKADRVKK